MMDQLPYLRDVPLTLLPDLLKAWGEPAYRGYQLARWLFHHGILAWDDMTNLPHPLRLRLAESYRLQGLQRVERQVSRDGTRKFLFSLPDGATVESVLIPMEQHATFCLSSQVGCRMACRFCATARGGLQRQLRCAEVLEQVIHLQRDLEADPIATHGGRQFNIVFMGMGEPLDNWVQVSQAIEVLLGKKGFGMSTRRITVSTSGSANHLAAMLRFSHPVGLTVSVGGATAKSRRKLMPVAGRTSLADSLNLAERYAWRIQRNVTIAYVLIAGESDSLQEAHSLARLVTRRPFKVNLIPLNSFKESGLASPDRQQVLSFQKVLQEDGITVFIRESGGQDIAAACGQLRQRRAASPNPDLDTAGLA